MPWLYSYEGQTWRHEDLTGNEIVALEKELGISYSEMKPGASMRDKLAVFATFLTRTRPEDVVGKIVGDATLAQLDTWITWSNDDDLPTMFEDGLPSPGPAPTG